MINILVNKNDKKKVFKITNDFIKNEIYIEDLKKMKKKLSKTNKSVEFIDILSEFLDPSKNQNISQETEIVIAETIFNYLKDKKIKGFELSLMSEIIISMTSLINVKDYYTIQDFLDLTDDIINFGKISDLDFFIHNSIVSYLLFKSKESIMDKQKLSLRDDELDVLKNLEEQFKLRKMSYFKILQKNIRIEETKDKNEDSLSDNDQLFVLNKIKARDVHKIFTQEINDELKKINAISIHDIIKIEETETGLVIKIDKKNKKAKIMSETMFLYFASKEFSSKGLDFLEITKDNEILFVHLKCTNNKHIRKDILKNFIEDIYSNIENGGYLVEEKIRAVLCTKIKELNLLEKLETKTECKIQKKRKI